MKASNFDIELAERRAEEERNAMIARTQAKLKPTSVSDCVDCGCEIPAARKAVLPSAERCVVCETKKERGFYYG